jgi:hypothetical protein
MSTTHHALWPTFDAFHNNFRSGGAHAAIGHLASALAEERLRLTPTEWRTSCAALDAHPAVRQLLEDPYSRDARAKPAGYAGDARTLDYVYLQHPGSQPVSEVGRALFDVSTSVPIAAAVRDRCVALADVIARRAGAGCISVTSIACGHSRELDRIDSALRERIRFWGMDQDARSIGHCRIRFAPPLATFEVASVRDLVVGRVRIPESDIVYASGLFDYLDQRTGAVLVKRMFGSVKLGGRVLVPNLTPRNDEVGYMEAVMDWWMCYRTEKDMLELAAHLNPEQARIETSLTSDGRVAWLQIERLQ